MSGEATSIENNISLNDLHKKGFKPAALEVLRLAVERGKIATHEIASFVPKDMVCNRERLNEAVGWINEFFRSYGVQIVTDRDILMYRKEHPPVLATKKKALRKIHRNTDSPIPQGDPGLPPELEALELAGSNYEHDILGIYYHEVSRYALLSAEEEVELGRRINEDRDLDARNKLVEHNLRLVRWIARRFSWCNLDFEDLVQEGNIGLMTAADRFDPSIGRFTTYASWWIRQSIGRAIADQGDTIRLPVHMHELHSKIRKATRELSVNGDEPTPQDVAAKVGLPEGKVRRALLGMSTDTVSLDARIDPSGYQSKGNDTTLGERIRDHGSLSPDQVIEAQEELEMAQKKVAQVLNEITNGLDLPQRNLEIFRLFYGFDGSGTRRTLEYVGNQFNVTRERIRQVIAKIWQRIDERGYDMDHDSLLREMLRIDELGKLASTTL